MIVQIQVQTNQKKTKLKETTQKRMQFTCAIWLKKEFNDQQRSQASPISEDYSATSTYGYDLGRD